MKSLWREKTKYLGGANSWTAEFSEPIQILYPPRRPHGRIALSTAESLTNCWGGYFDRRHSCTILQQNNVKAIKTSQGKPINAYAPSRHKPNVIIVATTNFSIDIARLTIKHLILRASLEDCRITFEKIWLRRCCSGSRQIISDRKFSEWSNSKLCCTPA